MAKRKGATVRRVSEGSVEQTHEPIQEPDMRRERRTSGLMTAKSLSIKGAERKFGGCARKADGTYLGRYASCLPESGLWEPRGLLTAAQKSAEGIVDLRERNRRPERYGVASRLRFS